MLPKHRKRKVKIKEWDNKSNLVWPQHKWRSWTVGWRILPVYLSSVYLPFYHQWTINNQPISSLYTFRPTSPSAITHLSMYGAEEKGKEKKAILILHSLIACQQSAAAMQRPTLICLSFRGMHVPKTFQVKFLFWECSVEWGRWCVHFRDEWNAHFYHLLNKAPMRRRKLFK